MKICAAQWVAQSVPGTGILLDISFPSIDTGYTVQEDGHLFRTINGGTTWAPIISSPVVVDPFIVFTDNQTGYSAWSDSILKTVNGGITWTAQTPYPDMAISDIVFPDANNGFAIGWMVSNSDSVITLKTTNAGASWTLVSITYNIDNLPFGDLRFIDSSTGCYCTGMGDIFRTTDAGATWTNVHPSGGMESYNKIHFLDSNTGFVAGYPGLVLKTTDAGATWTNIPTGTTTFLNAAYFIDPMNGFACGGDGFTFGRIFKTTNGGSTWTVDLASANTYVDFAFPSLTTGYVCGQNSDVHKVDLSIGIEENQSNDLQISVFPNPSSGQFTLSYPDFSAKEKICLTICDLTGRVVYKADMYATEENINLGNISKGIYFLRIGQNALVTSKLTIE
jgi:photosystem II stability/assembly factor-like uncharacterized protein